jgi:hypothetical protein
MIINITNSKEFGDYTLKNFNQSNYNKKIICVDGEDGIGKSTSITPSIAKNIQSKIISIDKYLKKEKGGYIDFIKYKDLENDVLKAIKHNNVIIEGVLLLKILERLKIKPNKFIYSTSQLWFDDWQEHKELNREFSDIIKKEESNCELFSNISNSDEKSKPYKLTNFRHEMYKYTYQYKPIDMADDVLCFLSDDWWKK